MRDAPLPKTMNEEISHGEAIDRLAAQLHDSGDPMMVVTLILNPNGFLALAPERDDTTHEILSAQQTALGIAAAQLAVAFGYEYSDEAYDDLSPWFKDLLDLAARMHAERAAREQTTGEA